MESTVFGAVAEKLAFANPAEASCLPSTRLPLPREVVNAIRARRQKVLDAWWATQFDAELIDRHSIAGVRPQDRETIQQCFLAPLFDLLVAYLETGEEHYRDVYLDERLRYAPHRAPAPVRAAFFNEILPADEEALIGALADEHEIERLLHVALIELHAPLRTCVEGAPVRVIAVGDCLMNEIRVFLTRRCRDLGIPVDFHILYFSALTGRSYSPAQILEALHECQADLLAFSFLSYDGIPPYSALLREADRLGASALSQRSAAITALIRDFLSQIRSHTDAPFLIHNASGLPLTRYREHLPFLPPISRGRRRAVLALNEAIGELVEHTPNAILIDEHAVARTHRLRTCARGVIPSRIAHRALFHTARFGDYLASAYVDVVRSYHELRRAKVLLVDFDNTLWEGVMADGPVSHRYDFQQLLRKLKEAGMLLVAVSKNDPANLRWPEMSLAPEDFVLHKINWNLKVQSIREVAEELDLGLDSFVFIDDNPVERELVRAQLPMVRTLDPNDPQTARWMERLLRFPNTRETEEARRRTELYREQVKRRDALQQPLDYPAMMASLALEVRFGLATRSDLERIAELVQRTNQFNTTTIRYSMQELRTFLDNETHGVYVASLSDKFGSIGLVAVAIVERHGADCIFDSFVMSCRAMGFGLEQLMLSLVMTAEERSDLVRFVGRLIPTARNTPVLGLFSSCGFEQAREADWIFYAGRPIPNAPAWFTVLDRSGVAFAYSAEPVSR